MQLALALAFLVVCSLACGDNRQLPDARPAADAATADAPPDSPDAAVPLAFVTGPTFTLPNPAAPLSGRIDLETNRPTRVSMRITSVDRTYDVALPTLAATHAVPVLELRAAAAHVITLTVTDDDGASVIADPIEVTTAAVPMFAATFTTTQLMPSAIEPGVTLAAWQRTVFAIDREGHYVWFIELEDGVSDVTLLPNGRFLVLFSDRATASEIDAYGTRLRTWRASNLAPARTGEIAIPTDSFHHELRVQADGDLLALSSERRELANYPTSETDPTPRPSPVGVIGDVIEVFAPDGTSRATHSLLDKLDPYRIAYDSFGAYWTAIYGPASALDWSHGNAVIRDPTDQGYIISLRHQDALVKLDAAGELVWILGTHDNWSGAFASKLLTPVGTPFAWPFHQHAPRLLANGNLLVFDNGNFRVSPPTPPPAVSESYSRAVEYAIDPGTMQVQQVWEYDANRTIFANATGDVDVGSTTGNVIVTFGAAGTIVEVTHTTPPVEVFRIDSSRSFYRSERVRSLYP